MSRNRQRFAKRGPAKPPGPSQAPGAGEDTARGQPVACLAIPPDPLGLNGDERRYADHLELRRLAGEIRSWAAHPEKFLLSRSVEIDAAGKVVSRQTFYTPDFRVITSDGRVEIHEVKGGLIRDDATVKMRAFVARHPYPLFIVVRNVKTNTWTVGRFTGAGEDWR